MSKRLKAAVCDTPKKMELALSKKLVELGYDVVYAGPLRDIGKNDTSARTRSALADADVWLTKWSFCLKGPNMIFNEVRPRLGLITMSVGTDHMDTSAIENMGLRLENCPAFCSNSVAEHALALAMRGLYSESVLPPLSAGKVIFNNFSDEFAEQAVAQILMRVRQMDQSMERAKKYDYNRHDAPWKNEELRAAKIGIIGGDRSAVKLVRMLRLGFNCELFGHDTSDGVAAYDVRFMSPLEVFDRSDYVFFCDNAYGEIHRKDSAEHGKVYQSNILDSQKLEEPDRRFSDSKVAILGTGRIGSILAKMARLGFNCSVSAYSTTQRKELTSIDVHYSSSVESTIAGADFIFIALPLTVHTERLLGGEQISQLPPYKAPVLVNVTRDEIVESESLFDCISRGMVMVYATDVLPKDKVLWMKEEPDDLTKKFVQHTSVVATPHEGDASIWSLMRLLEEVKDKMLLFEGGG